MNLILLPMLCFGIFNPRHDARQIYIAPSYSSYLLYQDSAEEAKGKWHWGVQTGIANLIPKITLKLSGAMLRYDAPPETGPYAYKYTPLILTTNFSLLPFLRTSWFTLNLETGLGLYLWQGLYNNQVIILPSGEKMDEKDLGFVAGGELQIKPFSNVAVFGYFQYHYLASANIYKYGFYDKDEKLLVNGFGIRFFYR